MSSQPNTVSVTTPAETASNDLREGVEKYVRYYGADALWLGFKQGMDFDGRSWLITITAWEQYEHDAKVENYRNVLISAVREMIAADAGSFPHAQTKLQEALAAYDMVRQQR